MQTVLWVKHTVAHSPLHFFSGEISNIRVENIYGVPVIRGTIINPSDYSAPIHEVNTSPVASGVTEDFSISWDNETDPDNDSTTVESTGADEEEEEFGNITFASVVESQTPVRVQALSDGVITATDIDNAINVIRQEQLSGFSLTVSPSGGSMYGGCPECYYYSMLFGGSSSGGVGDRKINSEEDFEVAKQEFVEHFNEKHKDIVRKRQEKPKIRKTYKKINDNYHGSFGSFGSSWFTSPTTIGDIGFFVSHESVGFGEAIHNHVGSREPEYQVLVEVRREHMDRQSLFRDQLLGRFRD